jgi:four helix bundle protein
MVIQQVDITSNRRMSNKEFRMSKENKIFDLEERLIDFAVRIIRIVESLPKTKVGNHIAGQLIRCGTSPAPNYGEAQSAESRSDFIHKMKVSLKELRETRVWLLIIVRAKLIKPPSKLEPLIEENNELISIFVASIKTAKESNKKAS